MNVPTALILAMLAAATASCHAAAPLPPVAREIDPCAAATARQAGPCLAKQSPGTPSAVQGEAATGVIASRADVPAIAAGSSAVPSEWHARWGVLADYVGQPLIVIDCAVGLFDPSRRVIYSWDIPGVALRRTDAGTDTPERVTTLRWDAKRGFIVGVVDGVGEVRLDATASGEVAGTIETGGVRLRSRYAVSGDRLIARLELDRGQGWVPHSKYVLMLANDESLARAPALARELGAEFSYLSSLAELNLRDGRDAGIPADW